MRTQTNNTGFPLWHRQNLNERTKNVGHQLRCPASQKKGAPKVRQTDNCFLKEKFAPVESARFDTCFSGVKDREGNSDYLFKSVVRYFELVKEPFTLSPSGNFSLDCHNLYNALKKILPEDIGINFDCRNRDIELLLFRVWNKFPSGMLFYIPISPLKRMNEKLQECVIAFLGLIQRLQGVSMPWNNQDINYFISEEYGIDMDEEDMDSTFKEIRDSYNTGEVVTYMKMIDNSVRFPIEVSNMIERLYLLDFTYAETDLIELIKEGLSIITEDRFFEYDYYPGNCIGYGSHCNDNTDVFDLDRLFSFVWAWEDKDMVTYYALESVNNDCQELTEYMPADIMYLTPDIQQPFIPNDFPVRYAKWFNRFVCGLEKYM